MAIKTIRVTLDLYHHHYFCSLAVQQLIIIIVFIAVTLKQAKVPGMIQVELVPQ